MPNNDMPLSNNGPIPNLLDQLEKTIHAVRSHGETTQEKVERVTNPATRPSEPSPTGTPDGPGMVEDRAVESGLATRLRDLMEQVNHLHRPLDALDDLATRIEL